MTAIPHTYDGALAVGADTYEIPISFLRSLAWHESHFDPKARAGTTSARGILQITNPVLLDWNKGPGAARPLSADALDDPASAGMISAWYLRREIALLAAVGVREDWTDPNFAKLLALAYWGGWSAVDGLPKVLSQTPKPWTPARAIQSAGVLYPKSTIGVDPKKKDAKGLGPKWSDPAGAAYVEAVGNDYVRDVVAPAGAGKGTGTGLLFALLGAGVLLAFAAGKR